mmetsp:Transcript_19161/g.56970  ORF Transcript_19161/g.56970 Transcript_19161/m.56970 type:complete len:264 (+) Transcript_19161:217-1008(+)|eukprot:CAMPEP_0182918884 /NCGR_PEP_ID=MMETSP0105_2-20130417/2352_1 /TAXON_ID=81532 ORGANISM="Acanthoeca-like sp., Strain 10tr" /NCGR_SAMPLE_ID=MMETSP0105_2 /ASSEMBLY_ACC=CAM_ASM_000205 /LENGTH=263 /DNA_ID=CAMNT_0025056007 /DNA_START=210 /DNA_END=1004 /DNA_ORIENTATION=+
MASKAAVSMEDELFAHFERAAAYARCSLKLGTAEQLQLYGLFKQATVGDCNSSRPGFFAMTDRAKWDAWSAVKGTTREGACVRYIELVSQVAPGWDTAGNGTGEGGAAAAAPAACSSDCSSGGGGGTRETMGRVQSTLYSPEATVSDADKTAADHVKDGNTAAVRMLLKEVGTVGVSAPLVREADVSGMTLLHWASDRGHLGMCELLLDNSADINALDGDGMTPLHFAAMCSHKDVYSFLLKSGADPSLKDADGLTAAESFGS